MPRLRRNELEEMDAIREMEYGHPDDDYEAYSGHPDDEPIPFDDDERDDLLETFDRWSKWS